MDKEEFYCEQCENKLRLIDDSFSDAYNRRCTSHNAFPVKMLYQCPACKSIEVINRCIEE